MPGTNSSTKEGVADLGGIRANDAFGGARDDRRILALCDRSPINCIK